jgi:hypothetical protein
MKKTYTLFLERECKTWDVINVVIIIITQIMIVIEDAVVETAVAVLTTAIVMALLLERELGSKKEKNVVLKRVKKLGLQKEKIVV